MIKKKTAVAAYKFRIGSNIRKWRNIKDIKQKELASRLHLSEAAVSNIENDITNITVTQLEDIATALNVSIEQLLSDPREKINAALIPSAATTSSRFSPETELLHAVIASLEKKDQQLQVIMQHFIHTINSLVQQKKFVFSPPNQVASRA
ncbi:hypothetical protein BH11BAC4_BH11BAC4_20620 [soil metagenome]